MDPHHVAIARTCLDAAYDNTMTFPQIVATLIENGFEGYVVDYRRNTTTYFRPDGESVALENRASAGPVAATFDQSGVAAQVRWAQSGAADYSYAAFCKNVKAHGCAAYVVSFLGGRVLYVGCTAETQVEHFPQ